MATITIDLPQSLLEILQRSTTELAADVRLAVAVDWYRQGIISQGRAAEIAGVSRADFIDALVSRGIDVIQLTVDELDRELDLD